MSVTMKGMHQALGKKKFNSVIIFYGITGFNPSSARWEPVASIHMGTRSSGCLAAFEFFGYRIAYFNEALKGLYSLCRGSRKVLPYNRGLGQY